MGLACCTAVCNITTALMMRSRGMQRGLKSGASDDGTDGGLTEKGLMQLQTIFRSFDGQT